MNTDLVVMEPRICFGGENTKMVVDNLVTGKSSVGFRQRQESKIKKLTIKHVFQIIAVGNDHVKPSIWLLNSHCLGGSQRNVWRDKPHTKFDFIGLRRVSDMLNFPSGMTQKRNAQGRNRLPVLPDAKRFAVSIKYDATQVTLDFRQVF